MARPVSRTRGAVAFDGGSQNGNSVEYFQAAGAPVDGTSGTRAGEAGPGSVYVDRTAGKAYINTNTKASPTWTVVGSQS